MGYAFHLRDKLFVIIFGIPLSAGVASTALRLRRFVQLHALWAQFRENEVRLGRIVRALAGRAKMVVLGETVAMNNGLARRAPRGVRFKFYVLTANGAWNSCELHESEWVNG